MPGAAIRHAAVSDGEGRFRLDVALGGAHEVALADPAYRSPTVAARPGDLPRELRAEPVAAGERLVPSSAWLARLPDDALKPWFLLDCTGCHQFNETRALRDGALRSADQWNVDAARMHASFGPDSGFPIISGHLASVDLGAWMTAALARPEIPGSVATSAGRFTLTEYDLPGPDLPHDVAVDRSGRVLVTGMFTDRILVLDPESGTTEAVAIPVERANPRALELDAAGDWWVLLGAAASVARYEPAAGRWTSAPVGFYGHSLAVDPAGGVWTNDHFARAALRLARVVPEGAGLAPSEKVGPPFATAARGLSPIPYELRVAPDGKVWTSLLHGNALVAFDPALGTFETIELPDPDAGPRRFDIDAAGTLWIPGYASGALYRFEPATGRFSRHPLPVADALPYVVRIDRDPRRGGSIWIGTGAADALFRFDPATATFTTYPVATRGATMRHLAIDPANGDVWVAYGASPAIHPTRIARLRLHG
jgi:virginiamycin B lyase